MECPVCYDAVSTVDLNCTHKMCQGCAEQWLQRNPTCPVCRAPVSHPDFRLAAMEVPGDATPVLTLDTQIDFDDDDDDYDEYEAAYMESLRERRRRGRQPAEPSNIVGW